MKKIKVGIIGCGTIGSALAETICHSFKPQAELLCVSEHRPEKVAELEHKLKRKLRQVTLEDLIRRSDFIIEAASVKVVPEVIRLTASFNKEVLVMSVGGLLDKKVAPYLQKQNVKLWVPSGALAGIDALLAGRESQIKKVGLVTRKPPQGLQGAPYFIQHKFPELKGKKEVRVFQGSAEDAVRAFPQNVNVAAILSLAGLGPRKTTVEVWTSRAYPCNQHEVTIEGDFGKITTCTQNVPSRNNPKTSALAIYSAVATLRRVFGKVRIGT